ncbi:MAG: hypothetical protein JWO31_3162, partial [Phycisphaerales bacterium]|nr:hypothetical protein [Phycisphaerales bacterium]
MPDPTPNAAPARPAPAAAAGGAPAAPVVPLPPPTAAAGRKVLGRMLDRLFASLLNGPNLNCRPHRSRQRMDWAWLSAFQDRPASDALRQLLGDERKTVFQARAGVARPEFDGPNAGADSWEEEVLTDQPTGSGPANLSATLPATPATSPDRPAEARTRSRAAALFDDTSARDAVNSPRPPADEQAARLQAALLQKLRVIASDARMYEQDTGVHVLNVGFPLLSLPPTFVAAAEGRQSSRRVLAPIAFIPVTLTLRQGATRSVEVACCGEGADLVQPNTALFAWLQQQTGRSFGPVAELFPDEAGQDPWREVAELVNRACAMVDLPVPNEFAPGPPPATSPAADADGGNPEPPRAPRPVPLIDLQPASRTDDPAEVGRVVPAAVLGLFPTDKQGLIRDMQEMADDPGALVGPVTNFIRLGDALDAPRPPAAEPAPQPASAAGDLAIAPVVTTARTAAAAAAPRDFADERLVAAADPCQARAVRLARQGPALVVHGPPGTGKSQTIANIIGDHLARGQRVLFVCEKRTAIDVVADRLDHMGLGHLAGVVHDPRRDQRELYKKIRDQLEGLADAKARPRAQAKLADVDAELGQLHATLTAYRSALAAPDAGTGLSFHELMGQWLASAPAAGAPPAVDGPAAADLAKARLRDLAPLEHPLREMFGRARRVGYATNPWAACVAVNLPTFLARPIEQNVTAADALLSAAARSDATCRDAAPLLPPFSPALDVAAQAAARVRLADAIDAALPRMTADVPERWAFKPIPEIKAARAKLAEARPYVDALAKQPLDETLAGRWLAAAGEHGLPAVKDLTDRRAVVQRYAEAFGMSMQWVEQIRARVPGAKWPVVARWVATETDVAAAASRRLEAVGPLADRA